jgi:hypothetical protein
MSSGPATPELLGTVLEGRRTQSPSGGLPDGAIDSWRSDASTLIRCVVDVYISGQKTSIRVDLPLKTVTLRVAKHLYWPFPNWGDEPVIAYLPAGICRVNFPVEGTEIEND